MIREISKDEDMTMQRCVIIGASPETDIEFIRESVREDDFVVCADGGYLSAVQAGVKPDLLIGDFDSSKYPQDIDCEIIRLPVMKDDTDTMSCIRVCLSRGYRDFLLLGMNGGRSDHTFANYSSLLFLANNGAQGSILDRDGFSSVIRAEQEEASLEIKNKKCCGFAVFPFGCEKCTVSLKGFLYNIEEKELEADFPIGVSNTVVSDSALVRVHDGSALIMVYAAK